MVFKTRDLLATQRTQTINAIREQLSERGSLQQSRLNTFLRWKGMWPSKQRNCLPNSQLRHTACRDNVACFTRVHDAVSEIVYLGFWRIPVLA